MTPAVTYTAKGSGPGGLVFLHGIGGDAGSFSAQLEALSRSRRTIAWNMPGYGGSPLHEPLSFEVLAAALERLLDRLAIQRADLFGHSIGGMVALEFAATRPGRVRSLILCAMTPAFGSRDGSFEEQFLTARLGPLDAGKSMADVAAAAVPAMVGADADPAGMARARESMSAVPAAAYRAAIKCLLTFDRRASLPQITSPCLVIAGERDPNAPARTMARMAEKIPNARYVEIAGAGHLLPLERPAEINRLVDGFLRDVEREAA